MNWLVVLEWGLIVLACVGAALALRAAAAAVRMAQLALAHAHQHPDVAPITTILHTGNGHAVPVPDQAPDAEIDTNGEDWSKQFRPPDSWSPWEEQR